jgi:porphobilinogen deaminase
VGKKLGGAGYASTIVKVRTTGDKRQHVPLAAIGGKGLFVKELEEALDRRGIAIALHTLKDVPSMRVPSSSRRHRNLHIEQRHATNLTKVP